MDELGSLQTCYIHYTSRLHLMENCYSCTSFIDLKAKLVFLICLQNPLVFT